MTPWERYDWIGHTQILLDSYQRWLGFHLIDRDGSADEQARRLFAAPFVVVSHGTQTDPILNYGNQTALDLWEMNIVTLLETPSRLTAERVHRDERTLSLERTTRDGYVDDYRGIRIARCGRRFLIERAIVWNLVDASGQKAGQAATFSEWTWLNE